MASDPLTPESEALIRRVQGMIGKRPEVVDGVLREDLTFIEEAIRAEAGAELLALRPVFEAAKAWHRSVGKWGRAAGTPGTTHLRDILYDAVDRALSGQAVSPKYRPDPGHALNPDHIEADALLGEWRGDAAKADRDRTHE